jgi:hypothetical protein
MVEAKQSDQNQIYGNNDVQKPRHDQNEDAGDQRYDGTDTYKADHTYFSRVSCQTLVKIATYYSQTTREYTRSPQVSV